MHGVVYGTIGKRMSGDMNTASGNCLLMYAMVLATMRRLGVHRWDCCVDGDDTLIFVEERDFLNIEGGAPRVFLDYGHEVKIENVSRSLEGIKWCQSKIIYVDGVPRFCRDWSKICSIVCAGVRNWHEIDARKFAATIGQCLLYDSSGVPVLQELCLKLLSFSAERFVLNKMEGIDRFLTYCVTLGIDKGEPRAISSATRDSFDRVFGCDSELQVNLEKELSKWDWPDEGIVIKRDIHNGGWMNNYPIEYPFWWLPP
jgi:hypothetical protein